jgi:serine protease Do
MTRSPSPSLRSFFWMVAVALIVGSAAPVLAQQKNSPAMLAAFKNVVARPSESTVVVLVDGKQVALGTIVATDGWIITKSSEIKGKPTCKLKDGRSFPAKITGVEDKHDLAMLKIDVNGLKPVVWADSKTAEVGNWLASPGTSGEPVAIGVLSVATRKPSRAEAGITSPHGKEAGYLGIMLAVNDKGLPKIDQVTPRSPASKAGLKPGDFILKVSGKAVKDRMSLVETIMGFKAGTTVTLEIKRGDEVKELRATLEKRPADLFNRADFQNSMGSKLSDRRTGFPVILQHDQVIKPTDCGGPVVDLDGKAVGINIARAGRVESYAIPTEAVLALVSDLKSGKLAPKEAVVSALDAAALEKALKKAQADVAKSESALKSAQDALENAEKNKQEAEKQLADARKKAAEAQAALDKAKKDATKK